MPELGAENMTSRRKGADGVDFFFTRGCYVFAGEMGGRARQWGGKGGAPSAPRSPLSCLGVTPRRPAPSLSHTSTTHTSTCASLSPNLTPATTLPPRTVRPEKSTRLPDRLPRKRPCLPLSRWAKARIGFFSA
jgi:hypothetical protein